MMTDTRAFKNDCDGNLLVKQLVQSIHLGAFEDIFCPICSSTSVLGL